MRLILTVLSLVSPAVVLAQQATPAVPAKAKIPATALLPDGSQLQGVMLPRYDEDHRLTGLVKARAMTLVNAGQIAGETVAVEFYNPDQSLRARIDLQKALFFHEKGLITAEEAVEMKSDRITATGTGLFYSFENGEGFLRGPATSTIQNPAETTMKPPTSPLRATALAGISLLAQPLNAAPPPALTAGEIAEIQANAVTRAPAAAAAATAANASLKSDLDAAADASRAASSFLAQANLPAIPPDAEPAAARPLEVKPGPKDTVINCTGGVYFDADAGVLVYLKNVTVKDPRYDLTGANELKIFFGKKPEAPKQPDPPQKPAAKTDISGGFGAKFGDVERIVATGAVRIDQKAVDGKEPIKASGAIFTYNLKDEQIILSGGYPWFTQGATYMRAKEPNLLLRLFPKTGSFVTEGNWEMGGNLEQKK